MHDKMPVISHKQLISLASKKLVGKFNIGESNMRKILVAYYQAMKESLEDFLSVELPNGNIFIEKYDGKIRVRFEISEEFDDFFHHESRKQILNKKLRIADGASE